MNIISIVKRTNIYRFIRVHWRGIIVRARRRCCCVVIHCLASMPFVMIWWWYTECCRVVSAQSSTTTARLDHDDKIIMLMMIVMEVVLVVTAQQWICVEIILMTMVDGCVVFITILLTVHSYSVPRNHITLKYSALVHSALLHLECILQV